MEILYSLLARSNDRKPFKIRDMWAIDAPNHGDAAVLNETALKLLVDPVWKHTPSCMYL
jgi:hypothetical protein